MTTQSSSRRSTVLCISYVLGLPFLQASGGVPAVLWEPPYFLEREGDTWRVKKPRLDAPRQAWTVFESQRRPTAEQRLSGLPRVRLNRALVRFNPVTRERTPIADWTGQGDAEEVEADILALLSRFAPPAVRALFSQTPLYMARLYAASGHTAEEPDDFRRFVIYLDPFRATGRLHAASTLVHELTHVERYRVRGFHANRAAAILPQEDFILLGLADELAGYRAEAAFIEAYLEGSNEAARIREAMPSAYLRWPAALVALLAGRVKEAREQTLLDLHHQAARYWESHRADRLPPTLETTIRDWYLRSPEWRSIAAQQGDFYR